MVIKPPLIFSLLAFSLLCLAGCSPPSNPVTTIVLDFPHGETRLLIRQDGETRLYYGALPQSQIVKPGLFDIDEIADQLQPRLSKVVPAEERPLGQPYGMVTLQLTDGSQQDYFIYDGAFAEALFQKARENIIGSDP